MKKFNTNSSIFTKKILSPFIAIALLFTLVNPSSVIKVKAATNYWTDTGEYDTSWYGDGSASEYTITSPAQLAGLAVLNNGLNSVAAVDFTGKTIKLDSNIDLTNNEWKAIGLYIDGTNDKPFKGTFDGQNHTISGIYIYKSGTTTSDKFQGLFGHSTGTIKNVGVITSYSIHYTKLYDNDQAGGHGHFSLSKTRLTPPPPGGTPGSFWPPGVCYRQLPSF